MINRISYGLPYRGSKYRTAKKIIDIIPPAEHFYDLFGGGAAVSHASLLSAKFKQIHYNDVDPQVVSYVQKAVQDGYRDVVPRWISREEFMIKKDIDMYIRFCWSYNSSGDWYTFSYNNQYIKEKSFRRGTDRIEPLERLDRIRKFYESIKNTTNAFHITQTSYDKVIIAKDSVIYCDIPYESSSGYRYTIDYDKFYEWAVENKNPVYFSSVEVPGKFHFHKFTINNTENLFYNEAAYDEGGI